MKDKEKILILFDGPHLAYSPTTIQLYDALSPKYEVTIVAQNSENYNGKKLEGRSVLYHPFYNVKARHFYQVLFGILKYFNKQVKCFKDNFFGYRDYFFKFLFIKKQLDHTNFKTVICIDNSNLFFCSLLKTKVDFVSLELCKNEQLLKKIDKSIIDCVIIQSPDRYHYLFNDEVFPTFYIQNAPVYKEISLKNVRKSLIYCGAANDVFGFFYCLNYLLDHTEEQLVVQGALLPADKEIVYSEYSNLIEEQRLIINDAYLDNNDIIEFIADYEIGFCFYNFDHPFVKANAFNYMSAPSGKMFKYLAAGVPVVCSKIPGFRFVEEFGCGILINDLSKDEIHNAILKIRSNYDWYTGNTIKAAKYYSFDKAVAPYLKFVGSKSH